jgi:beta-xylosidase
VKKLILSTFLIMQLAISASAQAGNDTTNAPMSVLTGLYADPHIAVFGKKYYIYPTTDGSTGWNSISFSVWSSNDLQYWTNEGEVLNVARDLSWANNKAWAPAIAFKNGKYYFYFSADGNIGVATGDQPRGPFKDAIGKPLVAKGSFPGQVIDPMVFTDDDGSSYLYFGQGNCYAVKLNDDMVSFDPAAVKSFKPIAYNEAPYMLKRNGKYYLMWSENDTRDPRYCVSYATADSPLGPFTKAEGGPILKAKGVVKAAGHHSVLQIPGKDEWYIVYHRFKIPGGNGFNRETCISPMHFDAEGKILPVNVFEKVKAVKVKGSILK